MYLCAGVSHSDDLIYLFPEPGSDLNAQDQEIAQTMVELWTNFATYGYVTSYLLAISGGFNTFSALGIT